MGIDAANLVFDEQSLLIINIALGLVVFGVSLDLTVEDFRRIFGRDESGKRVIATAPFVGLTGQFLILPAFTFLVTILYPFHPSIALGMIMVAACPGGNVSNFVCHLARGNTALSMCMTAISTAAAVVMTPFNITLWANWNESTQQKLATLGEDGAAFALDPVKLGLQIFFLLLVPLMLGMLTSAKLPKVAGALRGFFKVFSMLVFGIIIFGALAKNWEAFSAHLGEVALIVILHNALGLALGYAGGWMFRLNEADRRAVTVEVGMQNSAVALILIVSQFPPEVRGGMMMIAGTWGIWHNISGLSLGFLWRQFPPESPAMEAAEAAA